MRSPYFVIDAGSEGIMIVAIIVPVSKFIWYMKNQLSERVIYPHSTNHACKKNQSVAKWFEHNQGGSINEM